MLTVARISRSLHNVRRMISTASISASQEHDISPKGALISEEIPDGTIVFSMVQPTGKFHIGNYLGSLLSWKELCELAQHQGARDTKLVFGVADLHAITVPQKDPDVFRAIRRDAVASILASGVDPKKATIMCQSNVPQHAQLHWILSTFTSVGQLGRMTQWKSKSNLAIESSDFGNKDVGGVKLGLFTYPVLQAADILIYGSTLVPVGEDQRQHLELTRDLAERFNKFYRTKCLTLPKALFTRSSKIMSLSSPAQNKMSKSDNNQDGVIYLTDSPDEIRRKIRKSTSDSITQEFYYDPINRPGLSNLMKITAGLQKVELKEIEQEFKQFSNFKRLKEHVSEIIIEELQPIRSEFERLTQDPKFLDDVITEGNNNASELAEHNLQRIMRVVGLK